MLDTNRQILKKYSVNPQSSQPIVLPGKRKDLAELFGQLGFKTGAEVGVANGLYSEQICHSNPGVKLHCVDSWETYDGGEYEDRGALKRSYEEAKVRLANFNCNLIKKFSADAARDFKDSSLDFVYLDANHNFDFVISDIINWSNIVKTGGIVSGHDYVADNTLHTKKYGVVEAVKAYTKAHQIAPWFLFGDERSASWFWVKT